EPVLSLLTLTRALFRAGDETRAERLLRAAVQARPQEVVLHTLLGTLLREKQPPDWQGAVECYAAARALRGGLGGGPAPGPGKCGRPGGGVAPAAAAAPA